MHRAAAHLGSAGEGGGLGCDNLKLRWSLFDLRKVGEDLLRGAKAVLHHSEQQRRRDLNGAGACRSNEQGVLYLQGNLRWARSPVSTRPSTDRRTRRKARLASVT